MERKKRGRPHFPKKLSIASMVTSNAGDGTETPLASMTIRTIAAMHSMEVKRSERKSETNGARCP